jgi:GNAT superfamily N-acetyltransferase
MDVAVSRESGSERNRQLLEALTQRLPQWFGHPDANRHYAEQAERLDGWVARIDESPAGLLLVKRHSPASAEIYWLGVDPDRHRRGVGRALIEAVERQLKDEQARFLFVMTLHPDVDYEPYRRTRAFYERLGFSLALSTHHGPAGPSRDPLAYYLKSL